MISIKKYVFAETLVRGGKPYHLSTNAVFKEDGKHKFFSEVLIDQIIFRNWSAEFKTLMLFATLNKTHGKDIELGLQ